MAQKKEEAVSFEEIISKARERRKNQEFTNNFFERTRQKKNKPNQGKSAPSKNRSSLENRISSSSTAATRATSGKLQNRIHKPGAPSTASSVNRNHTATSVPQGPVPRGPRNGNRRATSRNQQQRIAAALNAAPSSSSSAAAAVPPSANYAANMLNMHSQIPHTIPQQTPTMNFSIRGAASGPCTVTGSNFAPGTTAADIQSAFEPEGGPMLSCVLVNTHPMVVAEMVFAERAGAESVIAKYNNQKADGRILHIRITQSSIYGGASAAVPTGPMAMSSNLSYESTRERANRERRERERRSLMDGRLYY